MLQKQQELELLHHRSKQIPGPTNQMFLTAIGLPSHINSLSLQSQAFLHHWHVKLLNADSSTLHTLSVL